MSNTKSSVRKKSVVVPVIHITVTALFMALNIVFSTFSLPVPGGHLYFCDVVICLASIILNPFEAFMVGGMGSFIGDILFYPQAAVTSLIAHGLQAIVISVFSHYVLKKHPKIASGIGVTIGALVMVAGYTWGKTFLYSTFEYAMIKLPYEFAQGAIGAVFGMLLAYGLQIKKLFFKIVDRY
jgi:uncharacterized membrane protein